MSCSPRSGCPSWACSRAARSRSSTKCVIDWVYRLRRRSQQGARSPWSTWGRPRCAPPGSSKHSPRVPNRGRLRPARPRKPGPRGRHQRQPRVPRAPGPRPGRPGPRLRRPAVTDRSAESAAVHRARDPGRVASVLRHDVCDGALRGRLRDRGRGRGRRCWRARSRWPPCCTSRRRRHRPEPCGSAVVDGPRDNQHVVLDASFFTPAGQGRLPAILLAPGVRGDQVRGRPGGRVPGPGRFRRAHLVPARHRRQRRADRARLAGLRGQGHRANWSAGWPGSPGCCSTGRVTRGRASPAPPTAAAWHCWPPPTTTGSTPWLRRAPGTTWPPRCSRTPRAAARPPGCSPGSGPGLLFTQGSAGFGTPLPGPAQRRWRAVAPARALRPVPAQHLRDVPADRPGRAGDTGGDLAAAAVQPGERREPDGRPHAADPGRARLPVRPRPGRRELPGDPAQRRAPAAMVWFAGGHDGGDQQTGYVDSLTAAWFTPLACARARPTRLPCALHSGTSRPGFAVTRVLGFDPSTDGVTLGTATAAAYPGLAGTTPHAGAADRPAAGDRPPARRRAAVAVRLPRPRRPRRGRPAAARAGVTFDMPGQSAAFTSAPLAAALQVTGSPTVRIRVSGAAQVTLFAKVYDVDQAGHATLPVPSWWHRCGSPARGRAASSPSRCPRSTTASPRATGCGWC